MKQAEIITLANNSLKSVPNLKKHIRLIDVKLNRRKYDMSTREKLHQEKNKHYKKLSRIIKVISTLEEESQIILCYKYFDKLTYMEIALRLHLGERTVRRRINILLLKVGRIMFGFEDEFLDKVHLDNYLAH